MSKEQLSSVIEIISGGTPKTSIPEYWNGDIGWLTVEDFGRQNKYVYCSKRTITREGVDNSSTKILKVNDIIISARGTVGVMAMLKTPMAFNQSCFGLRAKPNMLNQDYLFYSLKNYMAGIKAKTQGSVFETINLDTFDMLEIDVPPLKTQEEIVGILSALDNKIQINIKIISELESLAKTIYDYWFVQFDFPDENGKPYKRSGGKMVWNDKLKREIPEGWNVTDIGTIITESAKSIVQVNSANENGSYPFFTSGNAILRYNKFFVDGFNCYLNTGGNPGIKGYLGKAAYSTDTWCISSEKYGYWLYFYLLSIVPSFEQLFFAGSGLKHLQKDVLKKQTVVLPSIKVNTKFNRIVKEFFGKISSCRNENKELASLRDFLLPMLMNGQVKVGKLST